MKILKHGNVQIRHFTCTCCSCEFVAHMGEYKEMMSDGISYFCIECPDCGNLVTQKKSLLNTFTIAEDYYWEG